MTNIPKYDKKLNNRFVIINNLMFKKFMKNFKVKNEKLDEETSN